MNESKRPAFRDETAQGHYRRISTRIWNDQRMRKLGHPPPHPAHLFLYLLTHQDSKRMPALLRARDTALAGELGWPLKAFRITFDQLARAGMVEADWEAGVVWFPNAVKHDPPTAPNVLKSWAKIIRNEMPECALVYRAILQLRADLAAIFKSPDWPGSHFAEAFPEAFLKGLEKAFPECGQKALAMPVPLPLPDPLPSPAPADKPPPAPTEADAPTINFGAPLAEVVLEPDPRDRYRNRDVIRWALNADGCWAMIQLTRDRWWGLPRELVKPDGFDEWFAKWFPLQGKEGIEQTLLKYLADGTIAAKGHPTAVLISDGMYEVLAVSVPGAVGAGG